MTDPLVPAEVDLRDFAFMPLDVVRLRDSGLAAKATGDEFRAAVLLWCASWHQSPAASLPDDDAELANLCGYGRAPREWKKVRAGALHGWVACDDGRLYHPTVAEKAREAWASKLAQRARTEAARKAREEQRQRLLQTNAASVTEPKKSVTEDVTESKGQGQGQGQGIEKKHRPAAPADVDPQIWQDWTAVRKAKKAAVTETAVAGIRAEAAKAGMSLNEALRVSCQQGWAGFKAEWMHRAGLNGSKQTALETRNRAELDEFIRRGSDVVETH